MKIMKLITASIMLCLLGSFASAENPFKEGNKSYISGDYQRALDEYSIFIKDKPDFFEGYYNAGNAMFRQELYEDALKMYKKSLELNPKDEDTKINIEVTQEKLKEKEKNKDKKDNKKDNKDKKDKKDGKDNKDSKGGKDNKQDKGSQGKNGQDQQGQGNKSQDQKGQQGKNKQPGKDQPGGGAGQGQQQKPSDKADAQKQTGMSADEVQALMNMMQKSEKDYKNYFGKQYRHKQNQNDFPNVYNMTPEEIHDYMLRQMMEPDNLQQAPPKGDDKEKDW